jgi:ribosomal protein RSM22 (predicted rRNA methylase)
LIQNFQTKPSVYLSHEVFAEKSNAWAITPVLIDILNQLIKPRTGWLVVCESGSSVNWSRLLRSLELEDDGGVSGIDFEFSVFRFNFFLALPCRKRFSVSHCSIVMQQLSITLPSSTIHQAFIILTCGRVLHFPCHFFTGR